MSKTTFQSDVGTVQSVVLKHPRDAFGSAEAIERQWRELFYSAPPDLPRALAEYERFEALLVDHGVEVHYLPRAENTGLDSLYVRDAAVLSDRGAILCHMGKAARRGEPAAQGAFFEALGIPVLGTIEPPGTLEGGDVAWLDERTLAVGHGYRTNDEGIRQLCELLEDSIDELIEVPSPHWKGPDDVFHLMSMLSPLAPNLALVYSPLLPVPFRQFLLERGFELVEVPDEEFDTQGCNCLAIAPRRCLLPAGNPITRGRLEKAGVEVLEFGGDEICVKGGGGPTCLTRPLSRER